MLFATIITSLLHQFDAWGSPVPSVNIAGKQVHRTKFGGFIGLIVSVVITAFTISRLIKMVNRDDPSLIQVNRGLDLLAGDDESYNFKDNVF
jgi:large-conductance mechanosensitive channel